MKKFIFSALALCVGMAASAQLVNVESVSKISLPQGVYVNVPTISPDGSFVVVSDLENTTLKSIDLATGSSKLLTDNGSGHGVKISDDGRTVVFRQRTVGKNHLTKTGLLSVDRVSGKTTEIVKPSRNLNAGFSVAAGSVTAVENGRVKTKGLNGAKATAAPVVSINYGHLDVTVNGKTTTIDPQGRGSYLWPALSPDGTKIVYWLAGAGCFVCNLDGSNPVKLGVLRATTWIDNNTLVGMHDIDDGTFITSSELIATDLRGTRQTLTGSDVIALNPSVSADGKTLVFSTPDGELYMVKLSK